MVDLNGMILSVKEGRKKEGRNIDGCDKTVRRARGRGIVRISGPEALRSHPRYTVPRVEKNL